MVPADACSQDIPALSNASNILFLSPNTVLTQDCTCTSLFPETKTGPQDIIAVAISESPDALFQSWNMDIHHTGKGKIGFVSVGDSTRSASTATQTDGGLNNRYVIRTVPEAANLSKIGMTITEFTEAWKHNDHSLGLCFYTLTDILSITSQSQAYHFLTILTRHFSSLGATAHYHLDPTAIDSDSLGLLKRLFDTVITKSPDGEWHMAQ